MSGVCYTPYLAEDRKRTREQLLKATEAKLEKIVNEVARRTKKLLSGEEISVKVGKVIYKHKVGKHIQLTIDDNKPRPGPCL